MKKNLPAKKEDTQIAVPDEVIEEVVMELNNYVRLAPLELSCKVGKLIIDKFYDGDFKAWRKKGAKAASLRKLAEREDIPFKSAVLYRSIGIYEVVEKMGGVSTWKHLSASHIRAVLGLTFAKQKRLLGSAEKKQWTVIEIEKQVKKARIKRNKGGRPPLPKFEKSINYLERFVSQGNEYWGDFDKIDDIDQDKATKLYQTLAGLKIKCEDLQNRLHSRVFSTKDD